MKVRAIELVIISLALSCVFSLGAVGQLAMPYTNTFEGRPSGWPITNETGWVVADVTNDTAVVSNAPGSTHLSDFFPPATSPSNVLNIAGTVSATFAAYPRSKPDFIYIDTCVKPQFRTTPPFDQVASPPLAAVYVNSESNLVFYHNYFNGSYGNCTWSTNDKITITSNDWVRLTFEIFNSDPDTEYGDSFYRIWANGVTNDTDLYTNVLSYSLENYYGTPEASNPSGGPRNWFMTANSDGYTAHSLNSLTISGYAEIDDFYASTNRTFYQAEVVYTSHGVPHLWLASIVNDPRYGGDYALADVGDYDYDGSLNWQEYWAGTDLMDSNSLFKVVSVNTNTTGITLTWMGGTNEVNPYWVIYRTTNLLGDPSVLWTNDLNLPVTNVSRADAFLDSTNSRWVDTNGPTHSRLFYKLTTTTNAPN